MNKPNGVGLLRIKNAAKCSFQGVHAAFVNESAFRQEIYLCIFLFPISVFVAKDLITWVILVVPMLFMLFAELMNSAIEALADELTIEYKELIGRAKDMGSACVSIALLILILVWACVIFSNLRFE